MRVAFEALAWSTHIWDYRRAWKIVRMADHPALGTCQDTFHVLSRRLDPWAIRDIPGEKIFFVQLSDAPEMVMDARSTNALTPPITCGETVYTPTLSNQCRM